MRRTGPKLVAPRTIAAVAGLLAALAMSASENPYSSIVDRNPFGLKPPPPPGSNEPPPPPPVPPAKVVLTGLITMLGEPKALIEITETEGGKAAVTKKPILREGERIGMVEIVAIDVERSLVKIRNGGVESELTFETPKSPAPGVAAAAIPGALPTAPGAPALAGSPAAIPPGFHNPTNRPSNVTLMGGSMPAPASGTPGGVGVYGGSVPPALGASPDGLRINPNRPIRTEQNPNLTKEQSELLKQLQRAAAERRAQNPPPSLPQFNQIQPAPNQQFE